MKTVRSGIVFHFRTFGCRHAISPDSHALEHLRVGVEGEHGGAAHAGTVQQTQRQALHEGQGRGFGGAVVYGPRDGGLRQDGIYAHDMAVLQLQHPWQEGLCSLDMEGRGNGRRGEERIAGE